MENFLLQAHSGWRWIVLLLIVVTLIKALIGWLGKQKWSSLDSRLLLFSRIAVYIQVVLGVILYVLFQGWANMRFTGEHVSVAFLAVGGVEFGAARARKASEDAAMFKFTVIGFAIALILIFLVIAAAT
ncbi:MAG: hypothetical protein HS126_23520 [Anaerolineales bacterium]|nr:hypothetical protein [Anaerolineales bacterium]